MNAPITFDFAFLATFVITLIAVLIAFYAGFGLLAALRRTGLIKFLKEETPLEGQDEAPTVSILLDDPEELRRKSPLSRLPVFSRIHTRIVSAGLKWTVEFLLIFVAAGLLGGLAVGYLFPIMVTRGFTMGLLGVAGAMVPFLVVEFTRAKRMRAFEEQLPESLDFIARAIRAGHAFSVSLEMLASESPEPMRSEFRQVFNEVNLGSSLDNALKGLAARIPIIDVRFFVSAVLLQRETGGNLGEVLNKLSYTIRDRFRLKGQIRALTAHGRITATVLSALPAFLALLLSITSPEYLKVFAVDPVGRLLAIGAILGQILAYIIIRKMVNIRV